jgi:hypothetical protein
MDLNAKQLRRRAKKRWDHIFDRCHNPRCDRFRDYGGRGIKVCERWYEFEVFYADVGDPPAPGLSFDRTDNDGNYEPGNWRWATPRQQALNARDTAKTIIMDGPVRISQPAPECHLFTLRHKRPKEWLKKLRGAGFFEVSLAELKRGSDESRSLWTNRE